MTFDHLKRAAILIAAVTLLAGLSPARPEPPPAEAAPARVGPLSVRDFGAKGDGIADDSAAIQATIDAAVEKGDPKSTVRNGLAAVYLPAGTYRITAPIVLRSIQRLKLYGDGLGLTSFRVVGEIPAALELDGVAYCTFADFTIGSRYKEGEEASGSFDAGILLHWNQEASRRSTTNNRFYNIEIGGKFKVGIQIGAPGANNQVDQTQWSGCRVRGNWEPGEETWWQDGWRIGTGKFANNLIHSIYNIDATHLRNGLRLWAAQVAVYGGGVGENGTDFFLEAVTSYCHISGIRSESSGRLIDSGGPTGYNTNVTIEDVLWRVTSLIADDRRVISYKFPGSFILRNVNISGQEGKGLRPKLRFESGAKSLAVMVDGLTIGGDQTLTDVFETSGAVSINATGLSQSGAGGSQMAHQVEPVITVDSDYKVNAIDSVVLVDTRKAPVQITLPSARGRAGRKLFIKRVDPGDGAVSIRPPAKETIDGAAARVLERTNEAATFVSDGASWQTL